MLKLMKRISSTRVISGMALILIGLIWSCESKEVTPEEIIQPCNSKQAILDSLRNDGYEITKLEESKPLRCLRDDTLIGLEPKYGTIVYRYTPVIGYTIESYGLSYPDHPRMNKLVGINFWEFENHNDYLSFKDEFSFTNEYLGHNKMCTGLEGMDSVAIQWYYDCP